MKNKLTQAFNFASLPLYALNEGLQDLYRQGIPVYDAIPGGDYVRCYMSSFFGAYACAFVLDRLFPAFTKYPSQNALAVTTALLGYWEWTHRSGPNGALDWPDIGFYAVALPLYYALNKKASTPQAAPRVN